MENDKDYVFKDCVVIGAGISGIAISKWLKEYNIEFVVLEKSNDFGGLWRYRDDGYGVMSFTHINVSKYNYCFSDFEYPSEVPEFMHHRHIYEYVKAYIKKHDLLPNIMFENEVVLIEECNDEELKKSAPLKFPNVNVTNKLWKVTSKNSITDSKTVFITPYVSVCTGHHCKPNNFKFPGEETFLGEVIHSVKFKNSKHNKMEGKRVLLVGIGNSSVDIADNLVTQGGCPDVTISSRSGTWVFPNYITGYTADLFVNRFFLSLPWKLASSIFESLLIFILGHPNKYNLNPKGRILQSHPTVSPTLIHHIQRKNVRIEPNIKSISGSEVTFENGERANFDAIIKCIGYKINLDFLHDDIKKKVFVDENEQTLRLFKLVFQPEIGSSLGFLGFVQPHSGGILAMSEVQARWMVYLMKNITRLPSSEDMLNDIEKHKKRFEKRFYKSSRHTIQEDPITYNDSISSYFGAKPDKVKNLPILWRLMFSGCGPAQWRLNGPDSMPNAPDIIKTVPVPDLMKATALLLLILIVLLVVMVFQYPYLVPFLLLVYYYCKKSLF